MIIGVICMQHIIYTLHITLIYIYIVYIYLYIMYVSKCIPEVALFQC